MDREIEQKQEEIFSSVTEPVTIQRTLIYTQTDLSFPAC